MSDENIRLLKLMVRGSYDLQKLRIQTALRLYANFRDKLKSDGSEDGEKEEIDGELSANAVKVFDQLKASYRRLTDGIARNRTIPSEKGFVGDEVISTFTELVLLISI